MLTTSRIFQQSYAPGSLICWSIGVQNYILSDKLKEAGMFSVFSNNIYFSLWEAQFKGCFGDSRGVFNEVLNYWAYQLYFPCLISSYIYIYIYSCYSYIWINSLWNYKIFPFLMFFSHCTLCSRVWFLVSSDLGQINIWWMTKSVL